MKTGWPQGSPEDSLHREAIKVQMAIVAATFNEDKPAAEILFEDYLTRAEELGLSTHDAWMVYAVASKYWIASLVTSQASQIHASPIDVARWLAAEAAVEVGEHAI